MGGNPVIWFEIYVQDMVRAKAFYEGVFQRKLEPLASPGIPGMEMWSFPMAPDKVGAGGTLVRMEGKRSGGNSTLVYFSCEDCAVEAGRAAVLGGRVERGRTSIGEYGFMALVVDTEGNMIGLHSMK
jgi:uncharacterized protein